MPRFFDALLRVPRHEHPLPHRAAVPCRHAEIHALCLRLRRRCGVRRAAALQPARAQQRVRPCQPQAWHRRSTCTGQAVLRGGQHRPAQRQAEDLHQGSGAGGGDGTGCADHVRPRADHAGAPAFPAADHPPLGAGQRGELGDGEVLGEPGRQPRDPLPRAVAGGDWRDPRTGAGHGAGSVRPRRAVHGLFRPLPAVRLHQQARSQSGQLHQRLPLGVQDP